MRRSPRCCRLFGATIKFIELAKKRQEIFALYVLDEALRIVASKKFRAIFVGRVGLGFALGRPHVLEVTI